MLRLGSLADAEQLAVARAAVARMTELLDDVHGTSRNLRCEPQNVYGHLLHRIGQPVDRESRAPLERALGREKVLEMVAVTTEMRGLLRIKVQDNNDLRLAATALRETTGFFKRLDDAAAKRGWRRTPSLPRRDPRREDDRRTNRARVRIPADDTRYAPLRRRPRGIPLHLTTSRTIPARRQGRRLRRSSPRLEAPRRARGALRPLRRLPRLERHAERKIRRQRGDVGLSPGLMHDGKARQSVDDPHVLLGYLAEDGVSVSPLVVRPGGDEEVGTSTNDARESPLDERGALLGRSERAPTPKRP